VRRRLADADVGHARLAHRIELRGQLSERERRGRLDRIAEQQADLGERDVVCRARVVPARIEEGGERPRRSTSADLAPLLDLPSDAKRSRSKEPTSTARSRSPTIACATCTKCGNRAR